MNNIENSVTISGYKTEGGEIFENVSDEKIKLIYEILNEDTNFSSLKSRESKGIVEFFKQINQGKIPPPPPPPSSRYLKEGQEPPKAWREFNSGVERSRNIKGL